MSKEKSKIRYISSSGYVFDTCLEASKCYGKRNSTPTIYSPEDSKRLRESYAEQNRIAALTPEEREVELEAKQAKQMDQKLYEESRKPYWNEWRRKNGIPERD